MIIGSLLLIFAAVIMLGFGLPARSDPLLIGSIVATLFAVIVLIGSARRTAALRLAAGADASEGRGRTQGRGQAASTLRPGRVRSRQAEGEPVQRGPDRAPVRGTVIEGTLVEEPVTVAARPPSGAGAEPAAGEPGAKAATATAERTTAGPAVSDQDPIIPSHIRPTVDLNASPASAGDAEDADDYDGEFADEEPPGEPPPQLVSPADAALVASMDAAVLVVDGRPRYHRAGCAHLRGRPTEPLPVSEAVDLGFTPCSRCEPDTALIAEARSS